MSQRGGYGEGRGQPEPFRGGDVGGRGQPGPFRVGGRDGRGGSGRGRGRDRGSDSSNPNPSSSSSYYRPAPPSTHQVRSTSSSSSYRSAPPPLSRPRSSSSSSTYEVGSTSSSSVAIVDETLTAQVQNKLKLETSSSSVAIRVPPARPGFGTVGRKCIVKANHFLVSLQENEFHHYDVSITPEVISRRVNRAVMTQLVENYCNSHLGNSKPVYDGRKGLFTAGPLPFESKEFIVKLAQDEEPSYSAKREREFKVAIKLVARTNVRHLLEFLSGRQMDAPMDIIQTMDIVLRQTPTKDFTPVGRSFFSVKFGRSEVGDGVECWKGFYQSLRPTQMGLSLNIDVAATAFHEAILVIDYVKKLLNLRDPSRPLSDMDCTKIKKALRGLRVELTHTRVARQLKIAGITSHPLNQLTFTADASGQKMTVSQYFYEKYQIRLQFAHWPALQAGTDSKPIYLPFEVCKIIQGQRYSKKLNEKQVTAILRAACQRPDLREQNIYEIAEKNNYKDDEYAQQFGIDVDPRLTTIQEARILQAPMLKYHDTGREVTIQPRIGQWNMINAKMVDGATVRHWTCVNFSSHLRLDAVFHFVQDLIAMCASKGMNCNPHPLIPIDNGHADRIEDTLVDIHSQATARLESLGVQGQLQLLIIILPEFSGTYGTIKRICETELGIISQCCKPKNVLKNSKQYHENVALKINVKAGGRNTVLADALNRRIPLVTDKPTIIFGADVTHPNPGEDSSPSIAAVVASMDWPEITKYRALVSAQKRDEIIKDLSEMVRVLLKAFYESTGGMKPSRIIFYRDGVGEGQFSEVLLKEVDAIYEACKSINTNYLPLVTFVIVQKRHHTRLFPADHGNRNLTDKSGNILPGTVVDTQICHPSQFDFYLCSHAGIQGTSRPTHYHVLWDENNFTADTMQTLTNNLCYTYARCTRSVSVVPPAYYAHLAAFRARYYIEDDVSESGSSPVTAGRDGEIRPLPKIKDNVRDVMFYC